MIIQINIKYDTHWGEKVVLCIGRERLDMNYIYGGTWQIVLNDYDLTKGKEYTFEIVKDGQIVRNEWRPHRLIVPSVSVPKVLTIRDRWNDRPDDSPFYSSFFTKTVFKRAATRSRSAEYFYKGFGNVTFTFPSARIRPDQALAICGSGSHFDDWKKIFMMSDIRFPQWDITFDVKEAFEYKFLIVDKKTHDPIAWEEGANHLFAEIPQNGTHVVVADFTPVFVQKRWKGTGVAVPVFSLRSEDSFGIGEFNDIKKLVDVAVEAGQSVIQLLPVNDTSAGGGWGDSYPYSTISSFALHPQYLHLPDAGVRVDKNYRAVKDELNALAKVDYEKVNAQKKRFMLRAFLVTGKKVMLTPQYKRFIKDNSFWLMPYAAFCALRDEYETVDFSKWGDCCKFNQKIIDDYCELNKQKIDFYCYEQFCLDQQLKEAVSYAHNHSVALKGDLPIGVSPLSVETWAFRSQFHVNSQAGAPPDAFSSKGQNWGFPTYNWEKMAETGYSWWKARLGKMSEYFDAVRIDHILGFFRIWEIPSESVHSKLGHFSPALPYSGEELAQNGFDMTSSRYTTPLNYDWVLEEIFGVLAETVKTQYIKDGRLIQSLSTQKKVAERFPEQKDAALREGLMDLLDDVLFVEDPHKAGYYHPRIDAKDTFSYKALDEYQRRSFDHLYEDFFYHRHNGFWKKSAMDKLPQLLDSTTMLPCGEDLGMIPDCVPQVMKDLNILSLEIQRMPKTFGMKFGDPARYPYYSVCSTGTHDMAPIRAWWEEDRKVSADFYYNVLRFGGNVPYFCEDWVCRKIVEQHLASEAMLVILPLQDWMATDGNVRYNGNPADERINDPSVNHYYWNYRMHITLEDLYAKKEFLSAIRDMGRATSPATE